MARTGTGQPVEIVSLHAFLPSAGIGCDGFQSHPAPSIAGGVNRLAIGVRLSHAEREKSLHVIARSIVCEMSGIGNARDNAAG